MSSLEIYADIVPPSEFRAAYSRLIRAVWADASLADRIRQQPSLLSEYGFQQVPSRVVFGVAAGIPTTQGYDTQRELYQTDEAGTVTFFIPPQPQIDDTLVMAAGDSCCCCCCPCCCCT
jgi:hypothetical protein